MCCFYMGIVNIALALAFVKQANVEKSAPNHPGKPLHPQANVGKKCPRPSWQAFTPTPLTGSADMETTQLKRGLPLATQTQPFQD